MEGGHPMGHSQGGWRDEMELPRRGHEGESDKPDAPDPRYGKWEVANGRNFEKALGAIEQGSSLSWNRVGE